MGLKQRRGKGRERSSAFFCSIGGGISVLSGLTFIHAKAWDRRSTLDHHYLKEFAWFGKLVYIPVFCLLFISGKTPCSEIKFFHVEYQQMYEEQNLHSHMQKGALCRMKRSV